MNHCMTHIFQWWVVNLMWCIFECSNGSKMQKQQHINITSSHGCMLLVCARIKIFYSPKYITKNYLQPLLTWHAHSYWVLNQVKHYWFDNKKCLWKLIIPLRLWPIMKYPCCLSLHSPFPVLSPFKPSIPSSPLSSSHILLFSFLPFPPYWFFFSFPSFLISPSLLPFFIPTFYQPW